MEVWTLYKKVPYMHVDAPILFNTQEECVIYASSRCEAFGPVLSEHPNYEIKSFYLDDKCKCDDYVQTTMVLLTEVEKEIRIEQVSNLATIHANTRVPIDVDIETATKGQFQVMTLEYFENHYSIVRKHECLDS